MAQRNGFRAVGTEDRPDPPGSRASKQSNNERVGGRSLMTTRNLPQTILVGGAALALLAVLGWSAWTILRPLPTLQEVDYLAQVGRTEEAIEQARSYLRVFPNDSEARFRLAALLIEPENSSLQFDSSAAEEVLNLLEPVRLVEPGRIALVHLYRGIAFDRLLRLVEAEAAWKEAWEYDPRVPEAGWLLLQHYHRQRRISEARELGLRLNGVEPDPLDRVRLLVELIRLDVHRLAP